MHSIFRIAACLAIAMCCFAQKLEVNAVPEPEVKARLEKGVVKRAERENAIRELFQQAGCMAEPQRLGRKTVNVICTLPGQSDSSIVVGGHFDFVERGAGIVDDWSGASLLPSLYQALKEQQRRHTYVFIAFDSEEAGLVGSSRYVKGLSAAQRSAVRAFVNLECLGVGHLNVWTSRSTPALVTGLGTLANAMRFPVAAVNVDAVGDDDTHPFYSAHIPVISLHPITQSTLGILHSARDQVGAVDLEAYYNSYKFIAFYLAYLDAKAD